MYPNLSITSVLCNAALILFMGCGLFSSEAFSPDENNSWPFPTDCSDPWAESPIDLRFLNEKSAGEHGPIRRSDGGSNFVRGDGKRMRPWFTHMPVGISQYGGKDAWSLEDYRRSARFYARMGINMGIIGMSNPTTKSNSPDPHKVNPNFIESFHRSIAASKEAGIYTQLRLCWFHGIKGKQLGLDFHQERDLQCLLQFHPEVQAIWKSWAKEVLTTINPHTGVALKDEPALFSIDVANEDSLLFHVTNKIEGKARHELESQFYQWCIKKYGSADKALTAWGNFADKADAPEQKRLGLIIMWFLTRDGAGKANEQRCQDTLQFFIATMQAWQTEAKNFIQKEIGAKHILVAASNFNPADRVTMDDSLRLLAWQDSDIIENNHYFNDNGKGGPLTGYRIDVGYVQGLHSAVKDPLGLPTNKRQVADKPFFCTEILWPRPHPYAVEGPLMVAAYQSMSGIDGLAWAGPRSNTWDTTDSAYYPFWNVDGHVPLRRWSCAGPDTLGQFPAAAAMHRLGLIKEAPIVINEQRSISDIIQRKEPVIAEKFAYDPAQYSKLLGKVSFDSSSAHKEAFLIGRVVVSLTDKESSAEIADLSKHIDGTAIHSATGELCTDPAKGLFTINAPAVQAAAGFLRDNGPVSLDNITITCDQEHGSVTVIGLDAQPLTDSKKILIQIGTRSVPTGWKESVATYTAGKKEKTGLRIDATGTMPWRVRKCKGSVTFKKLSATTMTVLDGNGTPGESVPLDNNGGPITITLPENACYVMLQ